MIIDYSAHNTYDFCPAKWYESYVHNRRKKWPKAQRDDALALGSLVHEGLRIWQLNHVIQIPNEIIEEMSPTQECLALANELVFGYAQRYPNEIWPLVHCEEPLTFPLLPERSIQFSGDEAGPTLIGLAKIDSYFYVPELTEIESGIPGLCFTLTPGWWIHEYKTKSSDIPIGLYMQQWEMNLQASYQTLALNHKLQSEAKSKDYSVAWPEVQGVLVNVIEKPKRYVPKRKCRQCDESYEFYTWIPTGTGEYQCPICGSRQALQKLKLDVPARPPSYYRIIVTRSPNQLELDRATIVMRGQEMIEMVESGLRGKPWTHANCVDFRYKKVCDYFGPHKNNTSTLDDNDYETPVRDYRGLVQVEV